MADKVEFEVISVNSYVDPSAPLRENAQNPEEITGYQDRTQVQLRAVPETAQGSLTGLTDGNGGTYIPPTPGGGDLGGLRLTLTFDGDAPFNLKDRYVLSKKTT